MFIIMYVWTSIPAFLRAARYVRVCVCVCVFIYINTDTYT